MKYDLLALILATLLTSPGLAAETGQDGDPQQEKMLAADLAKLQGTWELVRRVEGKSLRSLKVIEGRKTTLTRYDPDGVVYWAHTSEFRISITGQVRIFTFFNLEATAGPGKGRKHEEPTSFIYQVDGNSLIEVHGMMIDQDDGPPRLVVWKRASRT